MELKHMTNRLFLSGKYFIAEKALLRIPDRPQKTFFYLNSCYNRLILSRTRVYHTWKTNDFRLIDNLYLQQEYKRRSRVYFYGIWIHVSAELVLMHRASHKIDTILVHDSYVWPQCVSACCF